MRRRETGDESNHSERGSRLLHIPDRRYIILPGDPMLSTEKQRLMDNTAFAWSLLPDWLKNGQNSSITTATTKLVGYVLTSVDRVYGHDTTTPGARFLAAPFGENSVPMFYHNGETAKLVLRETIREMNRHNKMYGEASAFRDPETFLAAVIAAAAADLISDGERVDEENRSAKLTASLMGIPDWGYDFSQTAINLQGSEKSMPEVIKDAIIGSTFNETTKLQLGGSGPVAEVVNDGDLSPLFLWQSLSLSMRLLIEDLWRKAASKQWGQVLREAALKRDFRNGRWIEDFFEFMDEGSKKGRPSPLTKEAGRNLILNAEFVDPNGMVQGIQIGHHYNNKDLQEMTLERRRENADSQRILGAEILAGDTPLVEAYRRSLRFTFK